MIEWKTRWHVSNSVFGYSGIGTVKEMEICDEWAGIKQFSKVSILRRTNKEEATSWQIYQESKIGRDSTNMAEIYSLKYQI